MSFKPQVQTDFSGKFYDNHLAFASYQEAYDNARDLSRRWMMVRDFRVVESDQPVNYSYLNGELKEIV